MGLTTKLLIGVALALLIAVFGFGWHLKGIYQGYVASTAKGDALYSSEVLADFGQQITDELVSKNVDVAIISRAGQPRKNLPKGVAYTHSAFFVRNDIGGYAVWNLYHGEDNRLKSRLETDTPADFLRLLREPDAGLIIPTKDTQAEIRAFIGSDDYTAMHTVDYSLISNPLDLRYQNCNEFMLYALGGMIWKTTDKAEVLSMLKHAIEPTELDVSLVRRHFGPLIDERLILDDHGKTVQTTTSADLAELLNNTGQLAESYRLTFKRAQD
ncbi:DUF2145 domain-containing protein [Fretibacter rubidus]|uniref:DUF2145 domain-containing protein n=1 Tax=Fretibacter rubidus TaxID=570162 RepID=UPI00352B5616